MAAAPQNPNQAIDMMTPITITHVILMVALALAAIAAIWWGIVQRRRGAAAQKQVEQDFEKARAHDATTEPSATTDASPPLSAPPLSANVPDAKVAPPTAVVGDLNQIKGLGPKLAATLAELGVTRIEQIAALTPQAAADLDAKLGIFQGRMERDRWIEQAKLLAAGDRSGYEAAFGKLSG